MIEGLEKLLAQGKDSPELRFGLGSAYLKDGNAARAAEHLRACTEQRAGYTAAWKLLGKALTLQELHAEALKVYRKGLEVAVEQGDKQAEKEMAVFAGRLERILQKSAD